MESDQLDNKENKNEEEITIENETDQKSDNDMEITQEEGNELSDQPEDLPLEDESEEAAIPTFQDVPKSSQMPKWLRLGIIYLAAGILLLLAGYLIAYFTAIMPAQKAYESTLSELNSKNTEVDNLQSQLDQTSTDLQEAQNNLDRIQQEMQSLEQNNQQLQSNIEFNQNLLSFKYEISLARLSLLNDDVLSARQALSLAGEYFENVGNLLDTEISSGIEDRMEEIQKLLRSDTDEAIEELRTLGENLERLPLR